MYQFDTKRVQLLSTCITAVQSSEVGHARSLGTSILFGVACGIHFHQANVTQALRTIPQVFVDHKDPTWEKSYLDEIAEFLADACRGEFGYNGILLLPFRHELRFRVYRHQLLRSYRAEKQLLATPIA